MSVLKLNASNYILEKLSSEVLNYLGLKEKSITKKMKVTNVKEESKNEKSEEIITMQNRKTCPVKVLSKEEKLAMKTNSINKEQNIDKDEQHRVEHLINYLTKDRVAFTKPVKMNTGLYEMNLIQKSGLPVTISVDINGLLYNDEIKFFLGKINPGEEYIKPAIMMTNESVNAIVKGEQIPSRFFITEQLFNLNKLLDIQTLKEKDSSKRSKVLENAAKAISINYEDIVKHSNNEPYRFAFARYINETEFSIVSSRRNLSSNLTDDHLLVSKEIWIKVKGEDVQLVIKSCDK